MISSRWRVAAGVVALLGSSLGQLAQYVVSPAHVSGGSTADQVAAVDGHGARMTASIWLDLLILLLIPAALYVGEVAGARRSRLAATGTVLVFGTSLTAGYLLALDPLLYLASKASDRAGAVKLLSEYESAAVTNVVIVISVLGGMIGLILLGIALVRARSVPVWAGVAVAVSAVLEVAGQAVGLDAVAVLAYLLRVVGFAACAVALIALHRAPVPEEAPVVAPSPA